MFRSSIFCISFSSRLNSFSRRCLVVSSPVNSFRINNFHVNSKNNLLSYNSWLGRDSKIRLFHKGKGSNSKDRTIHRTTALYASSLLIVTLGCTYASVPLYRIFCQAFGFGGTVVEVEKIVDISTMEKKRHREIRIRFNADVNASLNWNFHPQQTEITVIPGETALAFYTAENPLDKPVIGVSTYNVVPFEVGQYFNKIQCFCFEEQMLNPHEQVDMPVFFYIDPDFSEDPKMENVNDVILSYTFFEVKEGMNLPIPSYYSPHKK